MFYLSLQAKYLLPASTIQNVIDTFQELHSLNEDHQHDIISLKLKELSVDDNVAKQCFTFKVHTVVIEKIN